MLPYGCFERGPDGPPPSNQHEVGLSFRPSKQGFDCLPLKQGVGIGHSHILALLAKKALVANACALKILIRDLRNPVGQIAACCARGLRFAACSIQQLLWTHYTQQSGTLRAQCEGKTVRGASVLAITWPTCMLEPSPPPPAKAPVHAIAILKLLLRCNETR